LRGDPEEDIPYLCEVNVPILIGRNPVFEEDQVIFEEYKKKFILIPKEDFS